MATVKFIGADDATGTNDAANYFNLTRFQASATGRVTEFRAKTGVAGYLKVAIYADSGGEPGARLSYNDTGQAVAVGWNTLTIPALDITSGTYYWLAVNASILGAAQYIASGTMRYKVATYSTFTFPDPAGTGFTSGAYTDLIAGWGVLVVTASGISQPIALGSPQLNFTINLSGIAQAIDYGTPIVSTSGQVIQPSGIAQVIALGTPTLIKLLQIIYPSGISQPIALGTPALRYPQNIAPSGIAQLIVFGTPSVGVYGILRPSGIAQIIALGTPTVLKYVWHAILDGQYSTDTPRTNRAYVIGRDIYGNPVYGTAVDSTELGLVGERLDFQQDLAIPTDAKAADAASAILSKMRLSGKGGVILIPPTCGQELFDTVEITDSQGNQSAVKFRVVGIRFEYNPKQARYQHKLILGAP